MKVELKNIKECQFMSEETQCFTASIYIDNKKVGTVKNNGKGGCNLYNFKDEEVEQKFYAYCRSLPAIEFMNEPLPMDDELFIGKLLQKHAENKRYKNLCKDKFVFKLKSDDEDVLHSIKKIKGKSIEDFKAWLYSKYGDEVDYILNEKIA